MPTSRCNFYVVDSETKHSRKCKNKKNKNLKSDCCTLHYKLMYEKYIILIQKIFRGNKIRNKLDNIYKKLPDEIQRIVVNKAREYISYNNYKKIINNIIINRINNIFNSNYTYALNGNQSPLPSNVTNYFNMNLYIIDIFHICKLLNKYYFIYDINNNYFTNIKFYKLIRKIFVNYDIKNVSSNYCELIKYYDSYSHLKHKIL